MDASDVDLEHITVGAETFEILHTTRATTVLGSEQLVTVVHVCRPSSHRTVTVVARRGEIPHVLDLYMDDTSKFDDAQIATNVLRVFAVAKPWPTAEEFESWIGEIARLNGGSILQ